MNGLGRKKENNKKQLFFTKETFGVVLILFATLSLVCLITGGTLFSKPGALVSAFLLGLFGVFAYAVIIFLISLGVLMVADKKINLTRKRKILFTLAFVLIAYLAHFISMAGVEYTYGEYISQSYLKGAGGLSNASGGGFFIGLTAYLFSALLKSVGCYVVFSLAIAVTAYFLVIDFIKAKDNSESNGKEKFRSSYVKDSDAIDTASLDVQGEMDYPVSDAVLNEKPTQKLFVNNPNDFTLKSKREKEKDDGVVYKFDNASSGIKVFNSVDSYQHAYSEELKKKIEYVKTPAKIDVDKAVNNDYGSYYNTITENKINVSDFVNVREEPETIEEVNNVQEIPFFEHDGDSDVNIDSATMHARRFENDYASVEEIVEPITDFEPNETFNPIDSDNEIEDNSVVDTPNREEIFRPFAEQTEVEKEESSFENVLDIPKHEEREIDFINEIDGSEKDEIIEDTPTVSPIVRERRNLFGDETSNANINSTDGVNFTSRVRADNNFMGRQAVASNEKETEKEIEKPQKVQPPINRVYNSPPFDLLEAREQTANVSQENHEERMEIIQRTLEEFHINAVPQNYIQGPSITRYEIMMPAGVSVKKVLNYDDDLKMRLSAKDGVRIEAPIPGKNLVGIEVANTVKSMVGFREVMEGLAEKNQKKGALVFAIGKDIVGNSISYDLSKGPHYLIAGATGSGKSVCLHVMLVSLLMRYSPEELKLVLVDPKSVEFRKYEHIPHLLVDEIITEPKRVLTLLQWAYDETNRRNDMFTACGGEVSNIDDYNSLIASDTVPKLPRIVFFIDELADLMENCKKDLEARIRMIAAKSRSAGIHLVLATQRPSVDVITGTIKANLPSRIALKVMNFADSQTILGEAGAEKLLGNGDMLYKDSSMANYERYQGAYISGREITNVVNYIKENNTAYFDGDVQEFLEKESNPAPQETYSDGGDNSDAGESDVLFLKALWLAVTSGGISISLLQRRFRVGYPRAGGLVDKMERLGYISANEGSKTRRVLLSVEEFINKFGPIEDDGY